MSDMPDIALVRQFLFKLQQQICAFFEEQEAQSGSPVRFNRDHWQREHSYGQSYVLESGQVIEKGGVMFSHIQLAKLPASASIRYPQLVGARAEALGLSVVIHPKNPHVPTSHANVRLFVAYPIDAAPVWWFGGGFDLTPYYPKKEDCIRWHQNAASMCRPFGHDIYMRFKTWCDDYFYLPHRQEHRGIGGLFFDDLNEWSFERCFDFMQAVGCGYLSGIRPMVEQYQHAPYTQQQRDFQLYRRGRYVEYNLVYDRGTLFGLQSGGRVESILVSLPPLVSWHYDQQFSDDSPEAELTAYYLKPKDWLNIQ